MRQENKTLIQVRIHGSQGRRGRLPEVKNNGNLSNHQPKSGRLREVVAHRRWSLMVDSNYSTLTRKTLVFWKSGRLRKVVARGSSTVSCPSLR